MSSLGYVERVAVLYLLWKSERRQRRRPSVQRLLHRRSQLRGFHQRLQVLRLDDRRFQRFFRLSSTQFEELLSRVGPRITLQDTNCRRSVSTEEHLSICLRYLVTGDSYRNIADSFKVNVSTVSDIVPTVLAAIWDCLVQEFMPVPTAADWRSMAEEFEQRWNFPLCCGAVGGKYVQMEALPSSGSQVNSFEVDSSFVVLVVVDARYRFRVVDVGRYGKTSDGRILASSTFGQSLKADTLQLPPDQFLPKAEHRGRQPHVLVADKAFPLRRNMMRPFPRGAGREDLPPKQRVFNYRLCRALRVVEDTFGILTSQWRWYRHLIEVRPEVVEQCVRATCVLHNFMRASGGAELAAARGNIGDGRLRALGRVAANNSTTEARRVRDAFQGHFMAEGAVPWQPTE